jgi:nitroreductase
MSDTYNLIDATMKIIQDRRSIRDFTEEPVSDRDLDMILEAARQAPSGENAQPWRFVVLDDPAIKDLSAPGYSPESTARSVLSSVPRPWSSSWR